MGSLARSFIEPADTFRKGGKSVSRGMKLSIVRKFARRRCLVLLFAPLIVAGCSTGTEREPGRAGTEMSANASNITVFRENSPRDGLFDMVVFVNDTLLNHLDQGERYSFSLEPGAYTLSYALGLTECHKPVKIDPRRDYTFKLAPSCVIAQLGG
jgi:hypothetical protein